MRQTENEINTSVSRLDLGTLLTKLLHKCKYASKTPKQFSSQKKGKLCTVIFL